MDAKSIEWVMSQGIGAVLAVVMFLVYRKDVKSALNSWQGQTKILTTLVQEATRAMQANTDAVLRMEATLPHACPMAEQLANGAVEVITRQRERA
jgi:hypothetical protein